MRMVETLKWCGIILGQRTCTSEEGRVYVLEGEECKPRELR
jgi:hypothetical protein